MIAIATASQYLFRCFLAACSTLFVANFVYRFIFLTFHAGEFPVCARGSSIYGLDEETSDIQVILSSSKEDRPSEAGSHKLVVKVW